MTLYLFWQITIPSSLNAHAYKILPKLQSYLIHSLFDNSKKKEMYFGK